MPKMDLEDVTIHYEEVGSGPLAYAFCHGLGGNGQGFVEEVPFWRQHFGRVVTWDNRGLGQSSGAAKYSLPLYASDLARLLDRLGVQKAVVHGVSWGGVVAQQFALDYLDKCSAVIFDSTSSEVNEAGSENWYRIGEVVRLGAKAAVGEFQPAFAGHASSAASRAEAGMNVAPEHVDSHVANARATASLREQPFTPRLKHITCPVLIVAGGKDNIAGTGGSVIMSRNLPKARLEIFQDAGHGVYREDPEGFRSLVLEFCREQGVIKD